MLMTWRPGSMIGAPLMRPDSLRNAITEPVKVMAPMATPSDISTRLAPWMCAGLCRCRRPRAHRTRRPRPAPPPCRPASGRPRPAPASRSSAPGARSPRRCRRRWRCRGSPAPRRCRRPADGWPSVVAIAIAMPTMPNRLPWRDDGRARQPAQRQDEEHAGDEIEQRGEIGVHLRSPLSSSPRGARRFTWPSSCTSPACAG